jgi:hypothetical protein
MREGPEIREDATKSRAKMQKSGAVVREIVSSQQKEEGRLF